MTLHAHLRAWAFQNAWANHRLLGACAKLSGREFNATRTGFFPSICATANHIVTVDWMYVDAIERSLDGREPHPDITSFFRPADPFDRVLLLARAQRSVDRRLVAAFGRFGDADLERPVVILRESGAVAEALHRLLAHIFEHQIHHRGQIHAMLAGTHVPPPQLDEFFSASEAHLRAAELGELGYSEALVWGTP